jgi:hypothetical protein
MSNASREVPDVPGETFAYWLGAAAKQMREHAGVERDEIVALISHGKLMAAYARVERFEKAENWPRDVDQLVAAYAQAIRLDDPRDIYQHALDLWNKYGQPPQPMDVEAGPHSPTGRGGAAVQPLRGADFPQLPPVRRARTVRQAQTEEPTTDAPGQGRPRRRA